jgi:hypothetical protein
MQKYRRIIKKRMILCYVLAALSVGIGIFHQSGIFNTVSIFKRYEEISSFQIGLLTGLGILALFSLCNMVRQSKMIQN